MAERISPGVTIADSVNSLPPLNEWQKKRLTWIQKQIISADIDQEGIQATDICDVHRVIMSKAFPKAFSQPVNLNVLIPTLLELWDEEGYFDR